MRLDVAIIFVIGYLVFCFILDVFGISDLINTTEKLENVQNSSSEKSDISNIEGKEIPKHFKQEEDEHDYTHVKLNPEKKFIEQKTTVKVDEKSSPLTLSKEELGRHSWALIHSIAAAYPLEPTHDEQTAMKNFVNSL